MTTREQDLSTEWEATAELVAKVDGINTRLDGIEATITDFIESLKPYLEQVTPMIESVQASPMFRMVTGGKKKKP